MKRKIFSGILAVTCAIVMTSCYSLSYSVGKGSQSGVEVTGKNHYLIEGLVSLGTTTPDRLAGNTSDYDVTIVHTFVDGLISAITCGLYTPTTTIVTK